MLKKYLLLLVILLTCLFCLAPAEIPGLQEGLKNILTGQFSKLLGKPVKIEAIEGDLTKRITLKNVSIAKGSSFDEGVDTFIEKIEVEFDLKNIILSKFDLLPHLKEIKIFNPYLNIEHKKNGRWNLNILNLPPANQNTTTKQPLNTKLKIIIVEGRGHFQDEAGWTSEPLPQVFETELRNINGEIKFLNENLTAELNALIPGDNKYNNLQFKGQADLITEAFNFTVKTEDIALNKWTAYLLDEKNFTIKKGFADLLLTASKGKQAKAQPWFTVSLQLREADFAAPSIMQYPLEKINGKILIDNNQINFQKVKTELDQQNMILDGWIRNLGQPAPWLDLNIQGKSVALEKIKKYFSFWRGEPAYGLVDFNVLVKGSVNKLNAEAALQAKQLKYLNYTVDDADLAISYIQDSLRINIKKAKTFTGELIGKLNVDLAKKETTPVAGQWTFKNIDVAKLAQRPDCQGVFSGEIKLTGSLEDLDVAASCKSANLVCFEQKISKLQVKLNKAKDLVKIPELILQLNKKNIALTAQLEKDTYQIKFTEQPFVLQKEVILNQYLGGEVLLQGKMTGQISGLFKDPGKLQAQIDLALQESLLVNEKVKTGQVNLNVAGQKFEIKEGQLELQNSLLKFALNGNWAEQDYRLTVDPASKLALADLNILQAYFPDSQGQLEVAGDYELKKNKQKISAQLKLLNFQYNNLKIDKLATKLNLKNEQIALEQFELQVSENIFTGNSEWLLGVSKNNQSLLLTSKAKLNISTQAADLKDLVNFINNVANQYQNVQEKIKRVASPEVATANLLPLELAWRQLPLYKELSKNDLLSRYKQLRYQKQDSQNQLAIENQIKGKISGNISIENEYGDLKMSSDLLIKKGGYEQNQFNSLAIKIKTSGETIYGKTVFKDLSIADKFNYEEVAAESEFTAGVLKIKSFTLKENNYVSQDLIKGSFPIAAFWDDKYLDTPINVRCLINGSDLNIFSTNLPQIKEIHNEGQINLLLQGTFRAPLLQADKIELKNFYIVMTNPIYDKLTIRRADLSLANNGLTIDNLEFFLNYQEEKTPIFKLFGSLKVLQPTFKKPEQLTVETSMALKDIEDNITIKHFYSGDFELKNVSLVGTLKYPLSPAKRLAYLRSITENAESGPLLRGELALSKGNVYLPQIETKIYLMEDRKLSILLDLDLFIKNDVRVISEEIMSGEMNLISQINVGLRDENPKVSVRGTLNYPRLDGKIFFDDGYISFFYRRFLLLDKKEQEKYFGLTQNRANDNYLEIAENKNHELDPNFYVVAQTTVFESSTATANTTTATANATTQTTLEEKEYLAIINGSIFDLSSISFERYKKENSSYYIDEEPYVLKNKNTGELIQPSRFQELAYDIAPPLLKSAYSAFTGTGSTQQENKEAAREFIVSQGSLMMRYFMKPIERNIAKSTGLYDVRIKRDISQDAANILELPNYKVMQSQQEINTTPWFGLEMVKEISKDRLYFSVDTNIDQNIRNKNLNVLVNSYKFTWKIFRNVFIDEISLNYGNELDTYNNQYIPLLSLEGLHSF